MTRRHTSGSGRPSGRPFFMFGRGSGRVGSGRVGSGRGRPSRGRPPWPCPGAPAVVGPGSWIRQKKAAPKGGSSGLAVCYSCSGDHSSASWCACLEYANGPDGSPSYRQPGNPAAQYQPALSASRHSSSGMSSSSCSAIWFPSCQNTSNDPYGFAAVS